MKRTPIKHRSEKKIVRDEQWFALLRYLAADRAKGFCEICGQPFYDRYWGHHIQKRSQAGEDRPSNILMLCRNGCHDHEKYASGTRLSEREQLNLAGKLNNRAGISDETWNYKWGLLKRETGGAD